MKARLLSGAEAQIEHARALLLEASLDSGRWDAALEAVAAACGARAGQLISLTGQHQVSGHWISGVPEGFTKLMEDYGFADPALNPRFRLGLAAPLMCAVADQDFVDADERRRSAIYAEIYDRHDLPFNCQAVLARDETAFVRASITRSRKQGPLDQDAFRAFEMLMPHVHAAVRVQFSLLAEQCLATLRTLDAVGAAALLLSDGGRVAGISAAAEAMLGKGGFEITAHRLQLRHKADQAAFDAALARVIEASRKGAVVAPDPIPLTGVGLVLDVQMLPRDRVYFGGAPLAIVVVRTAKLRERGGALRSAFGLTRAEADVALALSEGEALEQIAARRGSSIATVRTQVQAIYGKMDVHRQAELAAAVRRLAAAE